MRALKPRFSGKESNDTMQVSIGWRRATRRPIRRLRWTEDAAEDSDRRAEGAEIGEWPLIQIAHDGTGTAIHQVGRCIGTALRQVLFELPAARHQILITREPGGTSPAITRVRSSHHSSSPCVELQRL